MGLEFHIYTNGTVYQADNGLFITSTGIEGLKTWLTAKYSQTTTTTADY
jgi:hypothetical protein